MGKKIVENHKIIPEEKDKNIVEELIQQQNITSEFSFVEGEEALEEAEEKKPQEAIETRQEAEENKSEVKEEAFVRIIVLTDAASYLDYGIRYLKNQSVEITDRKAYERLMKTGLFVCLSK